MSGGENRGMEPRRTPFLVGHDAALKVFLKAFSGNRLHHAWLLAGQKGIGKATLAYHLARFLLKHGGGEADKLFEAEKESQPDLAAIQMPEDDPVFSKVSSGAEGNLKVIERGYNEKTKRRRTEIVVEDVRALHDFFELTASRPGWRVAIIDPADEMNRSAANALLKMLEEPPARSILFLVTHAKGKLAPTIRSRCQHLLLSPLKKEQVEEVLQRRLGNIPAGEAKKLAAVAEGSPGFAMRLSLFDGEALYRAAKLLLSGQAMPKAKAHDFSTKLALAGNEEQYFLFLDILTAEIGKKIKDLAAGGAAKSRLDCWLELWDKVDRIKTEGEGLNLGRKQMLLLLLNDLAAAGTRDQKAA